MKLRLYAGNHAWLLVPDCMQASRAADRRYGPLEFLGEIEHESLEAAEWKSVLAGLDAESFATIPEGTARRLRDFAQIA